MTVGWSLQFVFWQAAVFLLVLGWSWWKMGMPRCGSPFGLRFADLSRSPDEWRDLHTRVGRFAFLMGVWLAVPLPNLADALLIQVAPVSIGSFVGVAIIRWRQVRRAQAHRS